MGILTESINDVFLRSVKGCGMCRDVLKKCVICFGRTVGSGVKERMNEKC